MLPNVNKPAPLLVVISGPSGVGKDAVMSRLLARDPRLRRALTMTTREPRANDGVMEESGVDYLFVSEDRFAWHVARGRLLEHAGVHDKQYGSPRSRVRALLECGHDVLLQVDVQGSLALRDVVPNALFLYIAPESDDILEEHLRRRGTDEATLEQRRADRPAERAAQARFDHVIVNRENQLEATVDTTLALIEAERVRAGRVRVLV